MKHTEEHILNTLERIIKARKENGLDSQALHAALINAEDVLDMARRNNAAARDRKALAKLVMESQRAANPRPIAELLHNCLIVEGASGGNPGMSNSPLVRICVNTLMNILGPFEQNPAYNGHSNLYSQDVDAIESLLGMKYDFETDSMKPIEEIAA